MENKETIETKLKFILKHSIMGLSLLLLISLIAVIWTVSPQKEFEILILRTFGTLLVLLITFAVGFIWVDKNF